MKQFLALSMIVFFLLFPAKTEASGELQQLIDATLPHETLELTDRVYDGNISIDKPMTIIGINGTVVRGDATGNVIEISSSHVHLDQLQIENSSFARGETEEYSAIKILTDQNSFKNLRINDAYHGIYLSQAHENHLENIEISGQKGQETIAGQGNGIHVYYSNKNVLKNIHIDGTRDGMYFEYSNENDILNNEISHTRYGLHYMYSNENFFYDNSFEFNIGGAAVMQSNDNIFMENSFSMNQSSRSFGLMLQTSNDNLLEKNDFVQNKRGLLVEQSQNNEILNNRFFQNDLAIEMWASSSQQVFTENQFHKNKIPVVQVGGSSENHWSKEGRGNDWGSDFPLLDLNQDGIGDNPVISDSSLHQLLEENELAYLMIKSPSIVIYEKMNQWMNNEIIMFQDEFPLQNREPFRLRSWMIPLFVVVGGIVSIRIRGRWGST